MPKPIGTLGTVDTLTLGGRAFVDLSNLIELYADVPASPNVVCGLALYAVSPSAYQVTNGKTLTIGAAYMFLTSAAGNPFTTIHYADSAVSVSGAAAVGSNVVYGPQILVGTGQQYDAATAGFHFAVPSQKYPAVVAASGTTHIQCWGYEA